MLIFFLFVLAIAPVKAHFLTVKYGYFSSLFRMALIRRAPKRGTSNEYPYVCFRGEIRKLLFGYHFLIGSYDVNPFTDQTSCY